MKASDQQPQDGLAATGQCGCACQCGGNADAPDSTDAKPLRKSAWQSFLARFSRSRDEAPAVGGLDADFIDRLIVKQQDKGRGLIELLQDVSEHFGYLPPEAMRYISETMNVPLTRLYSIATFYQDFKLKPQGEHRLIICTGTACHVKGAAAIVDVLCRELKIQPGDTTADGKLTLSTVNCIGLCGVGPVAIMDGEYQSNLTADKALQMVKAL